MNDDPSYSIMIKWLGQMEKKIKNNTDGVKAYSKALAESAAANAQQSGKVDLSNIQNANQYLEQRLKLIE